MSLQDWNEQAIIAANRIREKLEGTRKLFHKPLSILVYRTDINRVVKGWENPFDVDQICFMSDGVVMTFTPKLPVDMRGGIWVYEVTDSEATVFVAPRITCAEGVIIDTCYGRSVGFGRTRHD